MLFRSRLSPCIKSRRVRSVRTTQSGCHRRETDEQIGQQLARLSIPSRSRKPPHRGESIGVTDPKSPIFRSIIWVLGGDGTRKKRSNFFGLQPPGPHRGAILSTPQPGCSISQAELWIAALVTEFGLGSRTVVPVHLSAHPHPSATEIGFLATKSGIQL